MKLENTNKGSEMFKPERATKYYDIVTFDLGEARDGTEENFYLWDRIYVLKRTGTVFFRKDIGEEEIDLALVRAVKITPHHHDRFYLRNPAQADKSLVLAIGRDATFETEPTLSGGIQLLDSVFNVINPATVEEVRRIIGSPTTPIEDAHLNPYWTVRKFLDVIRHYVYHLRDVGLVSPHYVHLTSTPLGANASYTETWQDLYSLGFANVCILATSDQSGTLYVDFTDDQVNFKTVSAGLTGGADATITSRIYGRYHRVRYVNGATAQTRFTLSRRYAMA